MRLLRRLFGGRLRLFGLPLTGMDNEGAARRPRFRPKLLDLAIVAVAAAGFAFSAVTVYGGSQPSTLVVSSGSVQWLYPLSEDRTIQVEGALGVSTIVIEDGTARFLDSPCRNKTCVAAHPVHAAGDWSACLPNGVFIRAEGESHTDVDAIVR